jgi:vacuolar protein sorting-associated protein 16
VTESFPRKWELGKIVRFGWTIDEELVVLNEEGVYRIHDLQGDYRQFSLGSEAAETGVLDARILENGLVALTGALALLEVKGWQGSKPLTLATARTFMASFCLLFLTILQT